MCAGDVADGVDHDHDDEPPHDAYAGERNRPLAQVNRHRGAARVYHEIRSKHFCKDLHVEEKKEEHKSAHVTEANWFLGIGNLKQKLKLILGLLLN